MEGGIAIVGTGLIGGSIALGVRARGAGPVAGYDIDRPALAQARAVGAIQLAAASAPEAVRDASVVVLAVPLETMEATCEAIAPAVPANAVVTDVGSAKATAVATGEAVFGDRFVGGHPMAGSERRGFSAAQEDLFEDAWWVLTPTLRTSSVAYARVARLVGALGAKPVALDPEVHDSLVARLSHVPQLTASALVEVAIAAEDAGALLSLAAGGFRDVTRIAASHPDMWVGILQANRDAVLEQLEELGRRLRHAGALIQGERWGELRTWLARARAARLELFAKPDYGGPPVTLSLWIPDRPGVLAEVTTAAGELGTNIEDLRIVHSTEGGRGRLELVVAGEQRGRALCERLEARGYRVELGGGGLDPNR